MGCQETASSRRDGPGMREFVALMAFSMSLVALSIDAMLPAFPDMTESLNVTGSNDIQLVVSLLFIGLATGQLFYGPLSDSIGRKPAIYIGFLLFMAGSFLSLFASDFPTMLAGRLLQGFGAAGPRTVSIALIRDRYQGSDMARVMSFIMTVFILVPMFAPALGQAILLLAGWRAIFALFILLAIGTMVWLALRQPETLTPDLRRPFSLRTLKAAAFEVIRNRLTMVYTMVAGCVSGAFLAYLNSSQQIFQEQYEVGLYFPLCFATLALSVGFASILNSRLVMRFGMHALANRALVAMTAMSWIFLLISWLYSGHPPLWLFMALFLTLFFCIGVLFGNLNAIAMEPMGHVAGMAASVIGSVTTLLAVVLGFLIGQAYDGSLTPMAFGFVSLSTLSTLMTMAVKTQPHRMAGSR